MEEIVYRASFLTGVFFFRNHPWWTTCWTGLFSSTIRTLSVRLLLLAKDRPEMDSSFDASSAVGKLKTLFGPETEHARCTGRLCPVLFQLICDIGRVWATNVQEIEGCNNTNPAQQQVSVINELDAALRPRDDQKVDCPSTHSSGQVRVL